MVRAYSGCFCLLLLLLLVNYRKILLSKNANPLHDDKFLTERDEMLAELQFVTVGTGEELKELTARAVNIIEKSELDYQLTAMGILVEGEWDEIMTLVRKCHEALAEDAPRIVTNITIDDRKGERNRLKKQVLEVEYALGRSLRTGGLT